jgi:hypothetical protein
MCHNNASLFAFENKRDAENYLRAHGKKIADLNNCRIEDLYIGEIYLF